MISISTRLSTLTLRTLQNGPVDLNGDGIWNGSGKVANLIIVIGYILVDIVADLEYDAGTLDGLLQQNAARMGTFLGTPAEQSDRIPPGEEEVGAHPLADGGDDALLQALDATVGAGEPKFLRRRGVVGMRDLDVKVRDCVVAARHDNYRLLDLHRRLRLYFPPHLLSGAAFRS